MTANNVICIGHGIGGANFSNRCYIGKFTGVNSGRGTPVYINSVGQLGTIVSSQRFKDQIKAMEKASEAIFALKPVMFRYKQELDPEHIAQFGLIAEEVQKVNPDRVVHDQGGNVMTVRYEAVNAMLRTSS